MRITYLHQYFNTPAQSGGTRSYELARRLAASGHEVTMITSDRLGQGWGVREEFIDGIRVLWIPVAYDNSMSYSRRVVAFVMFAVRSARLASSRDCDMIYATSTPLTIAIPAMYAAWRRRVPWVLEVRDLWPEIPIAMGALGSPVLRQLAFALADQAYASSAHIVALSPGIARGIAARGVNSAKITTIPNGCDLELFDGQNLNREGFRSEHPELGQRPIVLYAGTIGKANGLEYLVDMAVAAQAQGSDVAFVVVGSGGRAGPIADRAKKSGVLGANFFMYPPVPKGKIANVIRAADLTLSLVADIAALNDNSANKFFDSLAAGRPIAINHEGWLADMIRSNEVGLVLPAGRPTEGAEALLTYLGSTSTMRRAGEAARALACQRYRRDQLFRLLESLLVRTAGG